MQTSPLWYVAEELCAQGEVGVRPGYLVAQLSRPWPRSSRAASIYSAMRQLDERGTVAQRGARSRRAYRPTGSVDANSVGYRRMRHLEVQSGPGYRREPAIVYTHCARNAMWCFASAPEEVSTGEQLWLAKKQSFTVLTTD